MAAGRINLFSPDFLRLLVRFLRLGAAVLRATRLRFGAAFLAAVRFLRLGAAVLRATRLRFGAAVLAAVLRLVVFLRLRAAAARFLAAAANFLRAASCFFVGRLVAII